MSDSPLEHQNGLSHVQLFVQFVASFCLTSFIILTLLQFSALISIEAPELSIRSGIPWLLVIAAVSGELLIYSQPKFLAGPRSTIKTRLRYLGASFSIVLIFAAMLLK